MTKNLFLLYYIISTEKDTSEKLNYKNYAKLKHYNELKAKLGWIVKESVLLYNRAMPKKYITIKRIYQIKEAPKLPEN